VTFVAKASEETGSFIESLATLIEVNWEETMDRQRIEGGLKKTTGTVKEQAGKIVGDRHLEREGKIEKTEGRIRSAVGNAIDAVRDVVDDEK
jgi:uncharacterized protein YjbJ (UPF0337 family)